MFKSTSQIHFAKVDDKAIVPTKREEDAGYDLYALYEQDCVRVLPHQTIMLRTGIATAFPSDCVAILEERSSVGSRGIGIRCGVVDSGYRGEWSVFITNHNDVPVYLGNEEYFIDADGHLVDYMYKVIDDKPFVFYPQYKAIAQFLVIALAPSKPKEISYDQLLSKFPSERGHGKMGSSDK